MHYKNSGTNIEPHITAKFESNPSANTSTITKSNIPVSILMFMSWNE